MYEVCQEGPQLGQCVQAKDANGLQKALANSIGNYQVVEGDAGPGQLQNVVDVAPFLKVRAIAGCEADKSAPARDKTLVNITEARVELFGIRCVPSDTGPGGVHLRFPILCPSDCSLHDITLPGLAVQPPGSTLTIFVLPQNTSPIWEQCNPWLCGVVVSG